MAETPPVEEKKSSKKLIIIIAIIVLLLGAGAGGYYFFMVKPADAEQNASADKQDKAEADKSETDENIEPEVYYEMLDPLIVNFPPGASAKLIKISVSVLINGESDADALKKHEPMIRNNLLMLISAVGADKAKTLEGKKELQASMLSEIGKVMEKMTKKNPVKDVFFTEFVMQ